MNNLFVSLTIDEVEPLIKRWITEVISNQAPAPDASTLPKYLTRDEVARSLQISLPTLDSYCRKGIIPAKRIGNRILFAESDIRNAMLSLPVKFSQR